MTLLLLVLVLLFIVVVAVVVVVVAVVVVVLYLFGVLRGKLLRSVLILSSDEQQPTQPTGRPSPGSS